MAHSKKSGLTAEAALDGDGRTFAGMGVDFADYNNDGLPDLVVDDLANQMYALYLNNGDGTFNYASYATGISRMTLLHSGWGLRLLRLRQRRLERYFDRAGPRPRHD